MWLAVDDNTVGTAGARLGDAARLLAGVELTRTAVGVGSAMPGSRSGVLAVEAAGALQREIAMLADDLAAEASKMALAAAGYAAAEDWARSLVRPAPPWSTSP